MIFKKKIRPSHPKAFIDCNELTKKEVNKTDNVNRKYTNTIILFLNNKYFFNK